MEITDKTIVKYLEFYAEPNSTDIKYLTIPKLKTAIVIPAFDEESHFIERLSTSLFASDILLICVINQPETQPRESELNGKLCSWLLDHATQQQKNTLLARRNDLHILAVDRFSEGRQIPAKFGVGLARKIGGDIAVNLFSAGIIQNNIVYSTDADATLPDNYLKPLHLDSHQDAKATSAYIFDFFHRDDHSNTAQATKQYEQAIKYFRDGLKYAGSPYAYVSLGSALAFSVLHYCQVRGFPKKKWGRRFLFTKQIG